ncbi:MAG: hypothetical protein WCE54_23590 [Ignavibacteriaceae bacterium]
MKTEIFSQAIHNRNTIKFLYLLHEVTIDPYFISQDKSGKKIIYGKAYNSSEIKKFEFEKIVNIRVLRRNRFSPIIPIIAQMN